MIVHSGGILDPGDLDASCGPLPGRLTVNGNVTIEQGGTLRVQVNGTTPGTDYDPLRVNGQVNLTGDPAGNNGGTLLVQPGFTIPLGSQFVIIDNVSNNPVDTRFLGLPEGALLPVGGTLVDITYQTGEGNNNVALRFGRATVTGEKYEDRNADGVMNGIDSGLFGWTITAFVDANSDGVLQQTEIDAGAAATTGTAVNGTYSLTLDPGDYILVETSQANWFESPDLDATEVNPAGLGNYKRHGYALTLTSNALADNTNFANYRNGTVVARKDEDRNADGLGDQPLPGWTISAFLDANNDDVPQQSEIDAGAVASGVTDINGNTTFSLRPGEYIFVETLQSGWFESPYVDATEVNPNGLGGFGSFGHARTVNSRGLSNDVIFANYQQATVTGLKYLDHNRDGVQDGIDKGLEKWTITAFVDANGDGELQQTEIDAGEAASITTGTDGTYSLTLDPGDYILVETIKSGWRESPDADATRVNPFGLDGFSEYGYALTLTSAQTVANNDFANFRPDSITVIKNAVPNFPQDFCFTVTGNGLTPFCLDDDSDPTLSDFITFEGLSPGEFTITETAVPGWLLTDISISGASGSSVSGSTATVNLESGENAVIVFTNVRQGIIVIGPDKSPLVAQVVQVIDSESGTVLNSFLPYERDFVGGVRVATGDVDGDGVDEIITAPGRGRAPALRIFEQDVANIAPNPSVPLQGFLAYAPTFNYGFHATVADVNGDGWNDIVTVPSYGAADVKVFLNTQNPSAPFDPTNPALVKSFPAFPTGSIGGWVLAADDMGQLSNPAQTYHPTANPFVNRLDASPQKAEIIVGTGPGLAAEVRVFTMNPDGSFALVASLKPLTVISSMFLGGVSLETARINADAFPDLLVGAGMNGNSRVEAYVWNGSPTNASLTTPPLLSFAAFSDWTKYLPVRVAAQDQTGDGVADVVYAVQGAGNTSGRIVSVGIDGTTVPSTVQPPTLVPGTYPAGYFIDTIELPKQSLGEGGARLPINPSRPGQNPVLPEDVNADGAVQPVDALIVINAVNDKVGSGEGEGARPLFVDVSGDNYLSALDVLLVINLLNRYVGASGGLSGEGEYSGPDSLGEKEFVGLAKLGEGEFVNLDGSDWPSLMNARPLSIPGAESSPALPDREIDAVWRQEGTTGSGAADDADLLEWEDRFSASVSDEDDLSDWDAVLSVIAEDEGWLEAV